MAKKKKTRIEQPPEFSFRAKIFLLIVAIFAGSISLYRVLAMGYSFLPRPPPNAWVLEYKLSIKSSDVPGRMMVFVPGDEKGQRVVEEQVLALGLSHQINDFELNRILEITTRGKHEPATVYYRAVIEKSIEALEKGLGAGETPDEEARREESLEQWLFLKHRTESEIQELTKLADQITQGVKGKSHKARLIFDHIVRSFQDERSPLKKGLLRMMRTHRGSTEGRVELFIDLCRAENIPARRVVGVDLEAPKGAEMFPWAEVYLKKRWVPVHLKGKAFGELPESFLAIFRGPSLFARTRNIERYSHAVYGLKDLPGSEGSYQREFSGLASFVDSVSLRRLPLETQKLLHSILLVPLAALLVCFFRVVLGFETIGTFLPVILALSFKTTDLGLGLLIVSLVILLGVVMGKLFDRLRLTKVPRSGLLVTLVVLIMAGLCVAGETLGLYRITNVALFPIVIMTLLVERLSNYWTEFGMMRTVKAYAGTAFVAGISFLIIDYEFLQSIFFNFPELLLINIVLISVTGTYRGKKLLGYLFDLIASRTATEPAEGSQDKTRRVSQ